MVTPLHKSLALSRYEIPDDTPISLVSTNRETPGLPSASCARIRGVRLRKKQAREAKDVLKPVQMNGQNTAAIPSSPHKATSDAEKKILRMQDSLSMSFTNKDETLGKLGNFSEMDISRVDDLLLEYQLKYEHLNAIMKDTQAHLVASQGERVKFTDAYNTCMKDLEEQLFARESELFKCQEELEKTKLELESTKTELIQMKEAQPQPQKSYEARAEEGNVTPQPEAMDTTLCASVERQQDGALCSTKMTPCGIPQFISSSDGKRNVSFASRRSLHMNTSLAGLDAPVMSPCTPKGISRKNRRSSIFQFIAEKTCETDETAGILKETICDLKEVLDCYATMTGLSISLDKSEELLDETNSKVHFKVGIASNRLHKDFQFSLCIDDAYDDMEYTPTFMENPDIDPSLSKKLPSFLMEKFYFPAEEGTLFLGDLLKLLSTT